MTGIGSVEVQQPRVRDRRPVHEREKFTSSILLFGGTVEFDQDVTNEAGGEIAGRGAVIARGGLTSRPFFTEKARLLGETFLPRIALGIAPLDSTTVQLIASLPDRQRDPYHVRRWIEPGGAATNPLGTAIRFGHLESCRNSAHSVLYSATASVGTRSSDLPASLSMT